MGPGRRVRGEATWAAAREAYLAGAAAGEVCERFDLGLTALRVRARREGWRRADQNEPDRPDLDPAAPEDDAAVGPEDLDRRVMIDRAWRLAATAVMRGRLREALGWTRLHRDLSRMAGTVIAIVEPPAAPEPPQARATEPHLVHSAHCLSSALRHAPDGDPHSAHPEEGFTQSRKAAKEGEKSPRPRAAHVAPLKPTFAASRLRVSPLRRDRTRRRTPNCTRCTPFRVQSGVNRRPKCTWCTRFRVQSATSLRPNRTQCTLCTLFRLHSRRSGPLPAPTAPNAAAWPA